MLKERLRVLLLFWERFPPVGVWCVMGERMVLAIFSFGERRTVIFDAHFRFAYRWTMVVGSVERRPESLGSSRCFLAQGGSIALSLSPFPRPCCTRVTGECTTSANRRTLGGVGTGGREGEGSPGSSSRRSKTFRASAGRAKRTRCFISQ